MAKHKPITPDHKPVPAPKRIAGRGITKPKNAPFSQQRRWWGGSSTTKKNTKKKDNYPGYTTTGDYNDGWFERYGCAGCLIVMLLFLFLMCSGICAGIMGIQ